MRTLKIRPQFQKVACCPYCIEAIRSHGEKMLEGEYVGEGECEWCGEVDELVACLWEVE